jgi:hypothetical protein
MYSLRDMVKEARPTNAIADFMTVFQQAGKNRWYIAAAAAMTTFGVFSMIVGQTWKKQRTLPDVTYITSWPEDRTAEETRAYIAENQRRKELREAELAKAEADQRNAYKALGGATGIDVDSIEQRAIAERAAEAAAEKTRVEAILKANGER